MEFVYIHNSNLKFTKELVKQGFMGRDFGTGQLYTKTVHNNLHSFLENKQHISFINGLIFTPLDGPVLQTHLNTLEGEFSGLTADKKTGDVLFFNNPVASAKIYYYNNADVLFISSSVKQIHSFLKLSDKEPKLLEESLWAQLAYGHTAENLTPIKEIFKVRAGEFVEFKNKLIHTDYYKRFTPEKNHKPSDSDWIEMLDGAFKNAFSLILQSDPDQNHQITLSGGLDSRMTAGQFLDYPQDMNIETYCMSQANYDDHIISQKIAKRMGWGYHFTALDDASYYFKIEENLKLVEGQCNWAGAAHLLHLVHEHGLQRKNLLYTGLIGDGILGGFNTKPEFVSADFSSGAYSQKYLHRTEEMLRPYRGIYTSEEDFKMYSRVSNMTMNGPWSIEPYTLLVSPFHNTAFIDLAFSIPEDVKFRERIYLKWIAAKHQWMTQFKWEHIHDYPLEKNLNKQYLFNRVRSLWYRRILKDDRKLSMNPSVYWQKTNPFLIDFLREHLKASLDYLPNSALREACINLFETGNLIEKEMAVSTAATAKFYQA